ncbi:MULTISPECIES: hypothetical protein [unclassified Streptomyces]|uniref:hypothetical protein n=1 Tax=unclassified Streptomyces TaxID=2593676 RepID=UPI002E810596|nr:hypothetical protein [Streptomyces sp. NBC_00589]WTI40305.1 hypothetical protein OIC96_37580 [Streptomyces sp. NBC_00775]WUB26014.1 hypothetical protein OHA51_12150 [Streptomyces sp. NBC_00589]
MSDSWPETEVRQDARAPEPGTAVGPGVEPDARLAGGPEPDGERDAEPAVEPAYEPAAPVPVGVPRVPTGNAEVDAQLDRLADADHLATDGHLEVYEDVHRGLRDALTALDARPGPPAPPAPYDRRS